MSLGAGSALDASVLVLNKPLHGGPRHLGPEAPFGSSCKDLAEVVTLDDGRVPQSYDFDSWREVSLGPGEAFRDEDDEFIRTVHFEVQVPEGDPAPDVTNGFLGRKSNSTGETSSPATATAASIAANGSPPAS